MHPNDTVALHMLFYCWDILLYSSNLLSKLILYYWIHLYFSLYKMSVQYVIPNFSSLGTILL